MDIYGSLFHGNSLLDILAEELRGIYSERGPVFAIAARNGELVAGNEPVVFDLFSGSDYISSLCSRIDDGAEPVIGQVEDYGIVGCELEGLQDSLGYVFVLLEGYSPEATMANIELAEMLAKTAGLTARVLEKTAEHSTPV